MWTNVSKPTSSVWSMSNPQGKEQYDQNIVYDDPDTFYDGINEGAYTSVAKPTSSVWSFIAKPSS